jgi:hypothetical protein
MGIKALTTRPMSGASLPEKTVGKIVLTIATWGKHTVSTADDYGIVQR